MPAPRAIAYRAAPPRGAEILQGAAGWRRRVAGASPRLLRLASRLRSLDTEVGVVARCVLSSPRQKKGAATGTFFGATITTPQRRVGAHSPATRRAGD